MGQGDERLRLRRSLLRECGAEGDSLEEALAYCDHPYEVDESPALPLEDEPHVDAWRRYRAEADEEGVWPALRRNLVQLRFPVREGMSEEEAYGRATRRGDFEAAEPFAPGVELESPEDLELDIVDTIAGHVPVVVAGTREDFVTLVQALTSRNEPAPVSDAMGACIVTGFNNWERIHHHRRRWEAERGAFATAAAWKEEFRELTADKARYQDRFIILSRGPYSAVSAEVADLDRARWRELSLTIRREHELTHYFTYRAFGAMRNNLLDEIVADFVGLVRATGTYDPALALRFLGLESFPEIRSSGRLATYRGDPPLSDAALQAVAGLACRAVDRLGRWCEVEPRDLRDLDVLADVTWGLIGLGLEGLAAADMDQRLEVRVSS